MSTKKLFTKFLFIATVAAFVNVCIWLYMGSERALEFLGGYIIELSLSVDNLFLFLLIFTSFGIKPEHQKRVLNYGIIGAIFLRFIFVVLGITFINHFSWILYIFAVLLLFSGFRMLFNKEEEISIEDSKLIKLLKKVIPVTEELHGDRFFVRINNVIHATPLFALIFLIEGSDIAFAIDSIPAIFSITTRPMIIYSSNILAILGLRTLYFLLEKLHNTFEYVKYGVGIILLFTGLKLGLAFKYHIGVGVSIIIIISILTISVLFSVIISRQRAYAVNK